MKQKINQFRERYKRFEPIAFFGAGFLFDVFTLRRIDDWLKIFFQIAFILLLGWLLLLQHREIKPDFKPPLLLRKIWHYQIEIVHFLFGSLLSAYVIFYFKSASATRSGLFLGGLVILMVLNEFPKIRALGLRLRVVLLGFCCASFLIYFLPLLAGYMSAGLFLASMIISLIMTVAFIRKMAKRDDNPREVWKQMGYPALAVQFLLVACYFLKVIPPVPLSMTFGGIYHKVEKEGEKVKLYSSKPWYDFWSHGERNFRARSGDPIYCFVRVFAPAKFNHKIYLRWLLYDQRVGRYLSQDHIGMQIYGGREEGFRGYSYKSNYQPGKWRVDVETDDDRVIGTISFRVENDQTADDRVWMIEEG